MTTGVRKENTVPPRQHSIVHYLHFIRAFGALNGLCSSITESKHIQAVKEPYRRSNRFEALGQMLTTNKQSDKVAAARNHFEKLGMLEKPRQGVPCTLTSSHTLIVISLGKSGSDHRIATAMITTTFPVAPDLARRLYWQPEPSVCFIPCLIHWF